MARVQPGPFRFRQYFSELQQPTHVNNLRLISGYDAIRRSPIVENRLLDMERTWSCFDCQFDGAEPLCFADDGTFEPRHLARILLKIAPPGTSHEEKGDRMRAYDCVDEMVQFAPEAAVTFILSALDECKTGAQVALLGAGALETLLKAHGPKVIGPLDQAAKQHAKVRYLLSATWGQSSIVPKVWEHLVAAVAPGPVMDADPRTPAAGMEDKILDTEGVTKLLATPMAG